jgi:2-polyprenyl-6-hydroxyphenyl methylase/3-demethylubiquinone-9 3-methyltransferase
MTKLNLSHDEIKTFDAVAEDWWSIDGAFKTLHAINPLRMAFITQQVDLRGKKVLDVGCGGGILTEALAKTAAQATGIDMSSGAIAAAKQHAEQQGLTIDYQQVTVEQLAEQSPASFDVVTCMEMLEHVPDPASIIKACTQLVKPDGHVFFSTLNRNAKSYLFAIIGAEYLLKLVPKGLHHYSQFIRPAELAAWSRQAGLEVKKLAGIGYHPLKQQYSLTANTDVNYLAYCQKM